MRWIFAACLFFVPGLYAQGTGTIAGAPKESTTTPLATANLVFAPPNLDSPLQLPPSPVVMRGGLRCGPENRVFLQIMTRPPMYDFKVAYSVTPAGKVVHYALEQMVGLTNPAVVDIDPGFTGPAMLLRASAAGQERPAANGYYLALFNYDGELRGYKRLDIGLEPFTIAQLADDSFLLVGTDEATAKPRFVVVDDSGTLLHDLDTDTIMPSAKRLQSMFDSLNFGGTKPDDMSASMRIRTALSLFREVHSQEGLLLIVPGSDAPVTVLLRSGETRVVHLKLPEDQIPHSIIPARGRWFVRTNQRGTDSTWNLYEVNPETGEVLRRINTEGVPATSIACPTDSGLYALRWIDEKPYLLSGTLQ